MCLFDRFLGAENPTLSCTAEPIQQRGSAEKIPLSLSPFPSALLRWLWLLSDSLLSVSYSLTWHEEGEAFLLWTVVSSQVSVFSVSIKCCVGQDLLNAVRGDESMPRKYNHGDHFFMGGLSTGKHLGRS